MKYIPVGLMACLSLGGCVVAEVHDDPYYVREYRGGYYRPVDPVCGVYVDPRTRWTGNYRSQRYYFHDQRCRSQFHNYPGGYARPGNPYRASSPYRGGNPYRS